MTQYHNKNYLTFERLQAYLEQYKLIEGGSDSSILEIGKGAGFFENLVNSIGYHYVSIDYDNDTKPDIVSDVMKLSLPDASFDYVYCCQVLEHLPFDKFEQAISELCRVGRKKIILSIPDNRKFFRFTLHIPKIKFKKVISLPLSGKDISIEDHGQHHWEIGSSRFKNCVDENNILDILYKASSVKAIDHYRFYERPYQHFFVLTREGKS
ncbi:MAG TPA: class I SAM-dependent methyltransferase [Nitrospirae bacterium]|nr:class I SAM-dependent methyltransferase [Nitrospirota bacterium]